MIALGSVLDLKGAFLTMPELLARSLDLLQQAGPWSPGRIRPRRMSGSARRWRIPAGSTKASPRCTRACAWRPTTRRHS